MIPSVGRIVHYVSHGTPVRADGSQAFTSQCRAAIVTAGPYLVPGTFETPGDWALSLCVLNPEGMFFNQNVFYHEGDTGHDHTGAEIPAKSYRGGSWHWPERVEG